MSVSLKGLAWDHRRCWGPLEASVAGYMAARPGLSIAWDRRSLYEFGEGRLQDAVRNYDLVVFDHPFVGEVASDGLLVALDQYLSEDDRKTFTKESVGKSWQSYQAAGKQWALPIDAAAQVAAYRPDLLAEHGDLIPRTYDAVIGLGRNLRSRDRWLGLPLVPTDAMCLVLTFAAIGGHAIGPSPQLFLEETAVDEIVARGRELAALSHPLSWSWNPIRCYEHMIRYDDVVYVPFAFGYVSYAERKEQPYLRFADIPSSPPSGSLLGGAGIGVSIFSKHRREAIDYALHLCRPEFQRTEYVAAGGQPGVLSAWTDAANNRGARDFFKDTLATLQGAYLRDTRPGFVNFFRDSAPKATAAFKGEISPTDLASWLNRQHAETSLRNAFARSPA